MDMQLLSRLSLETLSIMDQIDVLYEERKRLGLFNKRRKEIKQRIKELKKLENQKFQNLERFSILQM